MSTVDFPPALSHASWDRAAAGAKAKPATLSDGLKALKRLYDAVDFELFDIAKVNSLEQVKARREQVDSAIERRLKPLASQARSVESAAEKWLGELKKVRPAPSAAITATDAVSRGAGSLLRELGMFQSAAKDQLAKRLAELESAKGKARVPEEPKQAQHRLRLKAKVVESLRIVKNRPDREVFFVVCAGNRECLPYLGPVAGATQRVLLKTVMKNDTGLKFYRGRCVYEESNYTFVGVAMPSSLRNRLERGLRELTGSSWRVRVRTGTIKADPKTKA